MAGKEITFHIHGYIYAPNHFCASELFSTKQQQQPTYQLC